MAEVATARRSRITPEREAELYGAVLDLLREVGYDALTMDAVAARTRSSKATLYRQWGGKAELVVKAIRHNKPGQVTDIDTGSLRGDLHALLTREDDCTMEQNSALLRGVAMALHRNPDLRQALREQLIEPETAEFRRVLQRAVDRGEIRPDCPALDFLLHMMVGGFATTVLLDEQPPTRAFLASYIDAVILPALGVPAP
ncbi:TetR/AcrR family transcriptional regulator [Streptomyces griseoviridis]|jgi:AcrR family transcriptional regulator|uniref:AcrR family transcriptional regulator n=3 Tax=Streptomyces TaxID=1883 RepID=A0ABT9LF79_STRGD|nr:MULTISPECIES: TetR/AcrR family transcriptional regulator [Streptomyces]MDP9682303.1 AcrR family transcriptional regulator [Streptomyces griseoviridis]GGS30073.1 TetR family transcriptional regulator [Streptomyces niveoruber]GGS82437.1 TetR family transcriptional regulator [Streptomyces griseoviridis]GGU18612.1 TetR family transcriptional regulator [Streptomyces daghestanicus]GHI33688.1 TetR family transcriptional regulator [Streptomyces daghestanicus]